MTILTNIKTDFFIKSLGVVLLLLFSFTVLADEPYLHRVQPVRGENIQKLLKRYQLDGASCHFDFFLDLNDMNADDRLSTRKKYYLPVVIYRYNNTSIRSTTGIESWKEALAIKKYNETLQNKKLRKKSIVESRILWVPLKYLSCQMPESVELGRAKLEHYAYDLPRKISPSKKKEKEIKEEENKEAPQVVTKFVKNKEPISTEPRDFPIFGKKHAYTPKKDESLKNKIYYIVSGHGGPDPGAIGKSGRHTLCEDEYAYDVSLRLAKKIIERGGIAYVMTRDPNDGIRDDKYLDCDKDEYTWGTARMPANQRYRLYQRSQSINKLYDRNKKLGLNEQTMVCIHIDSRSKSQKTDAFFYYFPGSTTGKTLAKNLYNAFGNGYKIVQPNRGYNGKVSGRDLHMLRESKPNSVYIELGNIQNSNDQKRIIHASNRDLLADWLLAGITKKI